MSKAAARRNQPGATDRRRRDLAKGAYERLRDAIVTLQLPPGAPLMEVELSEHLHVSRTPIRAALQQLQGEGFVASARAGRVARLIVAPLTSEDMRELFLMVGALDGLAAHLAAAAEPERRAPVVERMERLNTELLRLSENPGMVDAARARDLDLRFHQCYERAAAGPQLLSELQALHARRSRYVMVYTAALVHSHNLRDSAVEHQAIIDAIRAGDPDLAERSAAFNYRNALKRYDRIAGMMGERGSWYNRPGRAGRRDLRARSARA